MTVVSAPAPVSVRVPATSSAPCASVYVPAGRGMLLATVSGLASAKRIAPRSEQSGGTPSHASGGGVGSSKRVGTISTLSGGGGGKEMAAAGAHRSPPTSIAATTLRPIVALLSLQREWWGQTERGEVEGVRGRIRAFPGRFAAPHAFLHDAVLRAVVGILHDLTGPSHAIETSARVVGAGFDGDPIRREQGALFVNEPVVASSSVGGGDDEACERSERARRGEDHGRGRTGGVGVEHLKSQTVILRLEHAKTAARNREHEERTVDLPNDIEVGALELASRHDDADLVPVLVDDVQPRAGSPRRTHQAADRRGVDLLLAPLALLAREDGGAPALAEDEGVGGRSRHEDRRKDGEDCPGSHGNLHGSVLDPGREAAGLARVPLVGGPRGHVAPAADAGSDAACAVPGSTADGRRRASDGVVRPCNQSAEARVRVTVADDEIVRPGLEAGDVARVRRTVGVLETGRGRRQGAEAGGADVGDAVRIGGAGPLVEEACPGVRVVTDDEVAAAVHWPVGRPRSRVDLYVHAAELDRGHAVMEGDRADELLERVGLRLVAESRPGCATLDVRGALGTVVLEIEGADVRWGDRLQACRRAELALARGRAADAGGRVGEGVALSARPVAPEERPRDALGEHVDGPVPRAHVDLAAR